MRRAVAIAASCVALVAGAGFASATPRPSVASGHRATAGPSLVGRAYVPGQILVRFRSGIGAAAIDRVNASLGVRTIQTFHVVSNLRLLALPAGLGVRAAVAAYERRPEVRYAEPNSVWHVDETIPNDPDFDMQWNWLNTGQLGGKPDADVDATDAWDLTTGSRNVVVAIIDTGVQYNHPDLEKNMWANTPECGGIPGVDDEGDGYIDDCRGIDTINHDSNPNDDFNHGTHLAGIIGGVGNNGVGVTGLNWHVTMLPCKSHDKTGNGTNASLLECLQYVQDWKDRGLNIVATNNSYGGCQEACSYSQTLHDAIEAQMRHGILYVASAGNDGANNDTTFKFPADYFLPNVIAVAASDPLDGMAFFSNYGPRTVSLSSPGESVWSTLRPDAYGYESGTSMSSPHVTGLAAMLAAYDPSLDWKAIRNLILAGGDPNDAALGTTISGRRMNANGSLTCFDQRVFGALRPLEITRNSRQAIAALNIDCRAGAGQLSVTVSPGGETIQLTDDGRRPDLAVRDGIYSGIWTPDGPGDYTLTFSNGQSITTHVIG